MEGLDDFFGGMEINEHEAAWKGKDWVAVQKLADQFKEKSENKLFSFLDAITLSKAKMTVDDDYSKFMIDTALSQHPDCISEVNVMNLIGDSLTEQQHFDYYRLTISEGRRYGKWASFKPDAEQKLKQEIIKEYYKTSDETAALYIKILEENGKMKDFLKAAKFIITDDFYKNKIKEKSQIKLMKEIVEEWYEQS